MFAHSWQAPALSPGENPVLHNALFASKAPLRFCGLVRISTRTTNGSQSLRTRQLFYKRFSR